MVKGTKRKATMEKITKRESAATTFTKRSFGLHSKVSQLCLLTGAQIAVLATPPSANSNSNVSFFSFGHSSVDSIVNAFLTGERPVREEIDDHEEDLGICLARKELGLPQWWEDDALLKSKNPQELSHAINSMSRLLTKISELRAQDAEAEPPLKKQKKNNEETTQKTEPTVQQTLVLPSGSSDKTLDYNNNNVMTVEELDQIMSTCDSFGLPHNNNNNSLEEIDFDQLIDLDLDFDFDSDNNEAMKMTEPLDQPLLLPYDICGTPDNNTYSTGEMSLDYGIDTSSVFVDDSLLESAMNCVASVDGFVETISTQEQLQETTIALNSVACDDASSAFNEDDINFSDFLTQFLQ
ncbi:unnamed protein product [Brassica oleracea]